MLHIPTTQKAMGGRPLLVGPDMNVSGLVGTHFTGCHIGVIPEGSEGRKVFQGPMVPGPWGFATTHAIVIDNHGGSGAENARAIQVTVGTPFTVEGLPGTWTFRSPNRRRFEGDGPVLEEYHG